jgi:5-methylthioadenosine/S-adenosylhomocysteine deaminase
MVECDKMYDIVIYNGTIITVNEDFDIIENGAVCISGEKIASVKSGAGEIIPEGKTMIDACGGIILPGLVNTHSHLPMTLFRGLADDLPLTEWLNNHIFPAEAKHINPESVKLGSLLGCAEMLLSGTTTCCDGYFYEDSVSETVLESGIRAIAGQGVIDFPAPGVPNPLENVTNAIRFIEKWRGCSSRLLPSIFCHSPYTCSKETLIKAKTAAKNFDVLFQIHAAETENEIKQIKEKHKQTSISFLEKIGMLDKKTLIVHAVWVNDEDSSIIKKSGAGVSVNTQSNMKLASGIAPACKFIENGISVGLGTDGSASNNDLDLFSEMDMTAKLHKVSSLDPTAMDAKTVLKMATIYGARAIGLGDYVGSIETGKQADIIIIDAYKPHLTPLYNPVSQIVYAASGADVKNVIVAGNILVKDYRLLTIDLEKLTKDIKRLSRSIK